MRKKVKAINRLGIGLGLLGVIIFWIAGIASGASFSSIVLPRVMIVAAGGFLVVWGLNRLVYWIYMGFKTDDAKS